MGDCQWVGEAETKEGAMIAQVCGMPARAAELRFAERRPILKARTTVTAELAIH